MPKGGPQGILGLGKGGPQGTLGLGKGGPQEIFQTEPELVQTF